MNCIEERLTTNKAVSEMSMFELAHNACYIKDGKARYRDYTSDMDARELTRKLLKKYAGGDDTFGNDEEFDECMIDDLQYGFDSMEGLLALYYRNLWAMADLQEKLKQYENMEEEGKILKLLCKIGDIVWNNDFGEPCSYTITGFSFWKIDDKEKNDIEELQVYCQNSSDSIRLSFPISEIGKTIFYTKEEAESALKILNESES